MPIAPGTRLGPYEVTALIGAGGMGEVYRARDTRLGRDVAIKILPAAADPERRARFEREARAVAALNHPNIVTIHAVEEVEGVPFFTMEYLEGRTLTQMIPPRGLPLDELLRIAIPLSDAVGAAHQQGILHRDLKPANVMVTSEGRVKVLDFGLAKLREAAAEEHAGSALTAQPTGEGRILGTAAYMSPEQAEGKALDQRSDVFSLGILLYEMATGRRPFTGDTSVSVLSAILRDTPGSVSDLRPDLPRDLARTIKRALTKDPEHRYQTAKDLRNDLETLKEDLDSGQLAPVAGRPASRGIIARHPRATAVAALAVVVLAAAGSWWASRRLAPPPQVPATRPFNEFTIRSLTTEAVTGHAAAISPDGRYVAYAFVDGGRQGLRVRQVETSATVQVVPPGDVQYYSVTFTPDGNRLCYVTYPLGGGPASLYEVSVLGGASRRLIEDVDSAVTFSPDGARLAFVRGGSNEGVALVTASADGTGEHVLAMREPKGFAVSNAYAWSPDGRTIAAAMYGEGARTDIVAVDAATGAITPIVARRWDEVESLAWERDGRALIVAAEEPGGANLKQLWEVTVPEGSVRRITRDIAGYFSISVSADGRTLVALRSEWRGTLWVGSSAQPDRAARVASVPNTVSQARVRWTPDDRILFSAAGSGNQDVWTARPDGSDLRQLTTSPGADVMAVAAPDGRCIVFVSDRDDRWRVWRMEPDGARQTPLTAGPIDIQPLVTGDGRSVYYVRLSEPSSPLYAVPIDGGEPRLLVKSPPPVPGASWAGVPVGPTGFWPDVLSPDGKLIAGTYLEGGIRVAVVPADGRGAVRKFDVVFPYDAGYSFTWAPDGRAITFARTADRRVNLWRQSLDGGPATRLTNYTSGEEIVSHAWSPDGKRFVLVRGVAENQVVMLRDAGGRR